MSVGCYRFTVFFVLAQNDGLGVVGMEAAIAIGREALQNLREELQVKQSH